MKPTIQAESALLAALRVDVQHETLGVFGKATGSMAGAERDSSTNVCNSVSVVSWQPELPSDS